MYKPSFFAAHEVLPPSIYNKWGDKGLMFMDERILMQADILRENYGPMTINNYGFGGEREWSGLRTPDSPYYSPTSQHSFGRAIDCLFRDIPAVEVREHLMANPANPIFKFITCVEDDVSWLHIDCRNTQKLKVVRP